MSADSPIRVRFAPSPTGMLHIGGARTALFNWAFARSMGGTFVLRIEDTDVARNSEESLASILDCLHWLGLDWDEGPRVAGEYGPYYQSQRSDFYLDAINRGISEGWLYRCFATEDELSIQRDTLRKEKKKWRYDSRWRDISSEESDSLADSGADFVWRFRVPDSGSIVFKDLIRGDVSFDNSELEDWVAVRSNGVPTYNFVCAIDDSAMRISHVIRGEEHLVNTPKQILLCNSLGLDVPEFAHVPLIIGEDGKKLSKRTGETSLASYIESGYPSSALFNFLCLLGFAIDDKTTIFSKDELLDNFSLARVSKSSAIFDVKKLTWMSGEYIRAQNLDELLSNLKPFLKELKDALPFVDMSLLVKSLQPRASVYSDFLRQAHWLVEWAPREKVLKELKKPEVKEILEGLKKELADCEWPLEDFFSFAKEFAESQNLGVGKVMKPLRCALTGELGGPELLDVLNLLGREQSLTRLANAIALL